jgi:hypothetical protein
MNSYNLSDLMVGSQNNSYPFHGIYNPSLTTTQQVEIEILPLIPVDQMQQMDAAPTEQIILYFSCGPGLPSNYCRMSHYVLSNAHLKIRVEDLNSLMYSTIRLEIGGMIINQMSFITNVVIASMLGLNIRQSDEYLLIPIACIGDMLFDKYIPIFPLHTMSIGVLCGINGTNNVLPEIFIECTHHMCPSDLAYARNEEMKWNAFHCQEMHFNRALTDSTLDVNLTFGFIVPYIIILVKDCAASIRLKQIELSLNGATPYVLNGSDIQDLGFIFQHRAFAISFCPEAWDNPTQLFDRSHSTGYGINFGKCDLKLEFNRDQSDNKYDFTIVGISHMDYISRHGLFIRNYIF